MKWLRLTLAVVLAGLVWIEGSGSQAHACSCAEVTDEIAYDVADDVFVGRVEAFDAADEGDPEAMARYVLAVDGVLKGDAFERQVVSTPQGGGACGAELSVDGTYLVFADRRNNAEVITSLCSGNRPTSVNLLGDTLGTLAVPTGGDDPGLMELASPILVESTTKSFPLWMLALLGVGLGGVGLKLRGRRRPSTQRSSDGES